MNIISLTYNPFEENTYILYNQGNSECIIVDPGCYMDYEKANISQFIEKNKLTPVRVICTHAHIDHVMGLKYICEKYQIGYELHEKEVPLLDRLDWVAKNYGFPDLELPPPPIRFLEEGETIKLGDTEMRVLFTPGHSPASVSFYSEAEKFIISGDVLFRDSIGRYDLPGASKDVLFQTLKEKFLTLPDDVTVYSGHGKTTTIGRERRNNPFLRYEV